MEGTTMKNDGAAHAPKMFSKHFSAKEFSCKCGCGYVYKNDALLAALEDVRQHFGGRPVIINSGCRCRAHNREVGGKENSRHLYGEAADIVVKGVSPAEVANYCDSVIGDRGGVGRYLSFTHIDVRGCYARWWE